MKYELLAEQNLALMLDFVDDENTKTAMNCRSQRREKT